MAGDIRNSLNGHVTLSGGTRTAVKTDRPWQKQLVYPEPGKCGLCNKDDASKYIPGPGWKTFQNAMTPFPYHRILIPDTCWENEKLRDLGGAHTLRTALDHAVADVKRTRPEFFPIWIYTHIGYGAGQNFPHHHWHLCGAPTAPKQMLASIPHTNDAVTLSRSYHFTTTICGVRAGQAIIYPQFYPNFRLTRVLTEINASSLFGNDALFNELVEEAHRLIALFNQKFNYPDYCLFFGFNSETDWYVRYTPILNNWGGSEFAALDHETPFVLPWPHEVTAAYLRGEQ